MLMIDLYGLILSPAFIGTMLVQQVLDDLDEEDIRYGCVNWSTFLSIAQLAVLSFGMFVTPASESRSEWYLSIVPAATHWARYIALLLFPILIIATNLIGVITKKHNEVDPVLIFNILIQSGSIIWFFQALKPNFDYIHEMIMDDVMAFKTIHRRCRHLGLMAPRETTFQGVARQDNDDDDLDQAVSRANAGTDDHYRRAGNTHDILIYSLQNTKQYKQLLDPLEDETDEEKKLANEKVEGMLKAYRNKFRDRFDGPVSIDRSLLLREDFYAATYLHWFKRGYVYNDGEDS